MLLGISSEYLYFHGKSPESITNYHDPYFLAFAPYNTNIEKARSKLRKQWEQHSTDNQQLTKIKDIGDIETYNSFSDSNKKKKLFKVYTKKSYFVPEVSDFLFFEHGLCTAEHDIPYHQRALIDLAADGTTWIFDTKGEKKRLKVLIYDIETTQYEEGKYDIPIDIIGFASFDIQFESYKNVETEEFSLDIIDIPTQWQGIEVNQLISRTVDEEINNLYNFCKIGEQCDIISGHNIIGFDNFHVYGRIQWILKHHTASLSQDKRDTFQRFINERSRLEKSFHFGIGSEVVQTYPCNFDTYLAARKFYSFLDEFSLKTLASFLGVNVRDRIFLTPSEIKIDTRTLKYNQQDVQEQIGVTLNLLHQALPLAFTTCMPFDMLLASGAVYMWDHMALLRGAMQRKIMPPICRAKSIAQVLVRDFKGCDTREHIVRLGKQRKEQLSKEFIRVLKYGEEMPEWVEYPYVIFNEDAKNADESLNYHIPGGMTIKPDKDARSHLIPWYYVIVADVGAMYPTILKAMNLGADTVRLASKEEEPDTWIWLKKLPKLLLETRHIKWRDVFSGDTFADKGYMLGIKIDDSPGVVNLAMTGIINMIAQIKKELKEKKRGDAKQEVNRLKMMYQSMKGARNAGTHGILAASTIPGRQFNIWGAAAITTQGQMILADTLTYLNNKGIRVVYGDTDGIYLACSRSVGNLPEFSKILRVPSLPSKTHWLIHPEEALSAVQQCNIKWRKKLNYPEFELEPENHDSMIFVKHKNYLIFDAKDGKIEMITKGNNFKGSDKANIARKVLKKIMVGVLKEKPQWENEEEARKQLTKSIIDKTKEIVSKLDLSQVDPNDLTLVQSVQPSKRYKLNLDGSISTYGKRAEALEKLLGYPIKTRIKLKFVVTRKPLPGIINPSKSGVKPIDYMYPVDFLENKNEIDLEWYKQMIENFIQGAFGLSDITITEQQGLDAWM